MNERLWTPELIRSPLPVIDGALRRLRDQEREPWRRIRDPRLDKRLPLELAISFDHFVDGSFTSGSSHAFSQTVSASLGMLIVDVLTNGSPPTVTFDGDSLAVVCANSLNNVYTCALYGPHITTANVNINSTGATYIEAGSCLYFGTDSAIPDATTVNSALAATSIDTSLTPVAANCWMHLCVQLSVGGGITPTNCVFRYSPNGVLAVFDSNGDVNGLTTLTLAGSSRDWYTSMISFAPAVTKRWLLVRR